MNIKTYELLIYLIENSHLSFKIDELAEKFNVSARSIRNYLSTIITFLESNNINTSIINTKDKIQYTGDKKLANYIFNLAINKGFYEYKLSSSERVFIIVLSLLTTDNYITLNKFEELLFTSKVTISNDMKKVVTFLSLNNIDLLENRRKGYILNTTEDKIRDCLYNLIKSIHIQSKDIINNVSQNICIWFFNNKLNLNVFTKKAETALSIVEQHFKITMSDEDYCDIILILSIILSRFSSKHFIVNYLQIKENDINQTLSNRILELMFDSKNDKYELISECNYLAKYITQKNLITEENNFNISPPVDYYIIVKSFLYKLSNSFSLNLLSDYKLQEYLTAHIVAMSNRLKNREKLINPYKDDLIKNYEKEYNIINNNLYILEDAIKQTISDDEITYIMMHIVAAIERLKRNTSLPKVLVLCHAGFGTSHFLAENLKKHFKIDIVDVTSSHSVQTSLFKHPEDFSKQCDFIISTTPIIGSPVPWIQVNPLLTANDIHSIHKMIADVSSYLPQKEINEQKNALKLSSVLNKTIHLEEEKEKKILLSKLLTEDHVLLDKNASDWKEAIIKAGEPLLWSSSITVEYLMAMVNSVTEHGPYIVLIPGFALAHAAPEEGSNKLDISFLRLKEPVKFGHKENDPVTFVIALSVAETKKNVEVILELMNVICADNAFEQFSQAKNEKEIIEIFQRSENNK